MCLLFGDILEANHGLEMRTASFWKLLIQSTNVYARAIESSFELGSNQKRKINNLKLEMYALAHATESERYLHSMRVYHFHTDRWTNERTYAHALHMKCTNDALQYVGLCEANELIYRRDSGRQFINMHIDSIRFDLIFILWRSQIDSHSGMSLCEHNFYTMKTKKNGQQQIKRNKKQIKYTEKKYIK